MAIKKSYIILNSLISIFLLFVISSCSFFNVGATAIVSFQKIEPATSRGTGTGELLTPDVFDVKIAAVYLSVDIDEEGTNIGENTPMIYLNPDCDGDIEGYSKNELSYFSFAASQEIVNEQINANAEEIPTLTYNYVRIEFYKLYDEIEDAGYRNVRWGYGSTFTQEFFYPTSTITVKFDEPFVVESGQAVQVILEYDFTEAITLNSSPDSITDDDRNEDVYDDNPDFYHFLMPEFHPVAEIVSTPL